MVKSSVSSNKHYILQFECSRSARFRDICFAKKSATTEGGQRHSVYEHMKCYVCSENTPTFEHPLPTKSGICRKEECRVAHEQLQIDAMRNPNNPTLSIDDLEDLRVAQLLENTGKETQWLDVVYFVVNDPLFRAEFLREIAQGSSKFVPLPTFTLNDDRVDWDATLAGEGIPKSRRRSPRTTHLDLSDYLEHYLAETPYLKSASAVHSPYIIMSYRERLHDSYESAVHYNGIIIDTARKLVYLFDPGVGLWGDLQLANELRKLLSAPKFVKLFGKGYNLRWLVEGCHIQKPTGVSGEKITRDNYCQTWSLYVFYRFIMDGGKTVKALRELKEMQSKWSQEDVLKFIGDDFLLGIVRLTDAYERALRSDTLPWNSISPVV